MKALKTQFRLNGLPYTLLKRNDAVALYGIRGTYTDEILHYEVDVIYTRKDKYFEELTYELRLERILSQGVVKSIAWVQENVEVMTDYQLV